MRTVDEYLRDLLNKRSNNQQYNDNEKRAYSYMYDLLNQWKQKYNSNRWINNIKIEIQNSGSKAKGDAIKGKSDIDLFVSITDFDNQHAAKDYYFDLYEFLKLHFTSDCIRLQNVSIGLKYAGCSIDVTPGKRINQQYFRNGKYYTDHYIYSRKNDRNTQTNIQEHIDLVKNSGLSNEMMLLKIWRNCHGLELPSIAIEIITAEVLKSYRSYSLYVNIKKVFESLRDSILTRRIIDPANSANNIADSMTLKEKQEIKNVAIQSLSYDHGDKVTTSKIVW